MKELTIQVEGMTCSNCSHNVESLINQTGIARNAKANLESGDVVFETSAPDEVLDLIKEKLSDTKFMVK